jgi:hypothetical protein
MAQARGDQLSNPAPTNEMQLLRENKLLRSSIRKLQKELGESKRVNRKLRKRNRKLKAGQHVTRSVPENNSQKVTKAEEIVRGLIDSVPMTSSALSVSTSQKTRPSPLVPAPPARAPITSKQTSVPSIQSSGLKSAVPAPSNTRAIDAFSASIAASIAHHQPAARPARGTRPRSKGSEDMEDVMKVLREEYGSTQDQDQTV